MIVILARPWFLGLGNGIIVDKIDLHWSLHTWNHTKLYHELLDPNVLFAASKAAIYSASIVDSTTVPFLELF
jgi:hypothetical protein